MAKITDWAVNVDKLRVCFTIPENLYDYLREHYTRHDDCEDIELPLVRNRVILHRYLGGVPAWKDGPAVEVRLYEVQGGKHSWALADFDTCAALWDFFKLYLR